MKRFAILISSSIKKESAKVILTKYKRGFMKGFPSACYEYVLSPLVNKDAALAYDTVEYSLCSCRHAHCPLSARSSGASTAIKARMLEDARCFKSSIDMTKAESEILGWRFRSVVELLPSNGEAPAILSSAAQQTPCGSHTTFCEGRNTAEALTYKRGSVA